MPFHTKKDRVVSLMAKKHCKGLLTSSTKTIETTQQKLHTVLLPQYVRENKFDLIRSDYRRLLKNLQKDIHHTKDTMTDIIIYIPVYIDTTHHRFPHDNNK